MLFHTDEYWFRNFVWKVLRYFGLHDTEDAIKLRDHFVEQVFHLGATEFRFDRKSKKMPLSDRVDFVMARRNPHRELQTLIVRMRLRRGR